MSAIGENLQTVLQRIETAARAAGRPSDAIRLLAVSKTFPVQDIDAAYWAGQRAFGESQQQEAVGKIAVLPYPDLEWHFIGPIQSNKTRPIAQHFDWVHAIDREKVARRLSEQRPPERGPLNACIEVNVSGEPSKSGVRPEEAAALAAVVAALPGIRLRGLMTIPEPSAEPSRQRPPFAALRKLFESLNTRGHGLDTLSMGMSDDLEAAIAEGATMVRVGSAIFGHRPS